MSVDTDGVREVFERLESLDLPYYMTGSEALARYSQPRQTMDVDIVVAITPARYATIAEAFARDFLVNQPIDLGSFSMASLIARTALGKADLILGRDDAWSRSALDRRERWDHPLYGPLWVTSVEDLLLAKLEWSQGVSELQLRDCQLLVELNRDSIGPMWNDGRPASASVPCWTRYGMRVDAGRSELLARVAAASVDDRVAWLAEARAVGIRSVWQQVDREGITEPIAVAEFLLRRLYPDLSPQSLRQILDQLRAARDAGTWRGFSRPDA